MFINFLCFASCRFESRPELCGFVLGLFFLFIFFFLLFAFRAVPAAYGSSQARGQIGAAAAGLHHSHSHTDGI